MANTVYVVTNRPEFEEKWNALLRSNKGVHAQIMEPAELTTNIGRQSVVVIDGQSEGYDDDELLATAGYCRAVGAFPAVSIPPSKVSNPAVLQVLEDVCNGLVAQRDSDLERLATSLARKLDGVENKRFEYVTVAPNGKDILAVLGNGDSVLLSRPLDENDDLSEVTKIELNASSSAAKIDLKGGKSLQLDIRRALPQRRATDSGNLRAGKPSKQYLKGSELGARLKQLRLAAGLTQAELARRTGIHRPNIARVEAGRHTPSLETLAKIAEAMGVPATRIFSDDA